MLISICDKEFKDNVNIRFNNISEGFNRFKSSILRENEYSKEESFEEKVINFTMEAFRLNGEENSYVDFYYNELEDEAKIRLEELLNEKDKEFLCKFKNGNKGTGIYFRLTEESIPFITRLNTMEILFCTIYFVKEACTIWGNYNKSFPILYENDEVIDKYKIIAEKSNLVVE